MHDEIGRLDALEQFRIGADAEIAGVAGMQRDRTNEPRRNVVATGSAYFCAKRPTPSHAASDQRLPPSSMIGARAPPSICASFAISVWPGEVSTGANGGASGTATRSTSMSSGIATTTGPGRPFAAV